MPENPQYFYFCRDGKQNRLFEVNNHIEHGRLMMFKQTLLKNKQTRDVYKRQ